MKIKCPKCGSDDIYTRDNDICVYPEDKACEGRIACDCMTCDHEFRVWFEARLTDIKISY